MKIANIAPMKKPKYEKLPVFVTLAIRNKAVSKPSLKIEKKTKRKSAKPEPAIASLTDFSISFRSLTCFANQKIIQKFFSRKAFKVLTEEFIEKNVKLAT